MQWNVFVERVPGCPKAMNESFALIVLQSAGMHARSRIKKALLLRRQRLQLEIVFREGEIRGLQLVIDSHEAEALRRGRIDLGLEEP